jgi:CBS domain-containing protein
MAQKVRELMTANPLTAEADDSLQTAAQTMRDADVGALVVTEAERILGVVTDRDIAVRAVADGMDPRTTRLAEFVSHEVVTVSPDDDLETASELMRTNAIRRLAVVDGEKLVGMLSLGDLAMDRDPSSVLADISEEPPNN